MIVEDWASRALGALMERVEATESQVGARFPLYADPEDGRWTTTGRGSWAGGFWAGLLWLRARYTGADADRAAAMECTGRLAHWAEADTATRGLILWYGTALATGDDEAGAIRKAAAEACLLAHDPALGLVPWGDAFGGPRLLARADAVPGMLSLLAAAGPGGAAAAAAHLHRHLDLCLGGLPEGQWPAPAWQYTPGEQREQWQPLDDPPAGWSRGRAWMLLAVAEALLHPELSLHRPDRLAAAAEQLLARGGFLMGPLVPPAEAHRPDGPLDTSAAAITAVALMKLARVPGPWVNHCSYRAVAILIRLSESHLYHEGATAPVGRLVDGCYDAGKGLAVRHELIWGTFFLTLALAALDGYVDITRV
ncbi:sugar ABC transporter permease [Streptomyces sp. WAC06614]|uniref:sugar ABC transporter permease n=1 Tax=Streptomyces sp. WAC06614 TaxID=2487416 RepID=UPI000F7A4A81|nr:sugar ABC transporter permease [Streptomyces sp. WAC06614]RSS78949.1 sugar ABC transporter permease [Streptomyces sp. WAC06614]